MEEREYLLFDFCVGTGVSFVQHLVVKRRDCVRTLLHDCKFTTKYTIQKEIHHTSGAKFVQNLVLKSRGVEARQHRQHRIHLLPAPISYAMCFNLKDF